VDGSDPDHRQRGLSLFLVSRTLQGFLFMHEYNEEEDTVVSVFLSYLMCVRYSELDPNARPPGGGEGAIGL